MNREASREQVESPRVCREVISSECGFAQNNRQRARLTSRNMERHRSGERLKSRWTPEKLYPPTQLIISQTVNSSQCWVNSLSPLRKERELSVTLIATPTATTSSCACSALNTKKKKYKKRKQNANWSPQLISLREMLSIFVHLKYRVYKCAIFRWRCTNVHAYKSFLVTALIYVTHVRGTACIHSFVTK